MERSALDDREAQRHRPRRLTAPAAVLVALSVVVSVAAQDWNQWRGPARTGATAAFIPPASWPDKPTRVWEARVGTGHASPIVSGRRVFALSRLDDQETITAFDLDSGKRLWEHRYAAPYEVNPAAASHGKGPKSTPVAAGSRLFTFGINGALSALDAASGKLIWRRPFGQAPDFGVAMSPLVQDGLLIVHVGGNKDGALSAVDAATGAPKWQWAGDGPAYASPVLATFAGVRQVITQSRSHVVSVDFATGVLLWRIPFTTAYDQNSVTPTVAGELVIFSGIEKPLTAVRVSRDGGQWKTDQVWQNETLPLYMNTPVVVGTHLYGLTHRNRGQFFCVDLRTGRTTWTTRGREAESAALVTDGKLILATTTEGELVVFRADPAKFEAIKRYTVAESPIWAHPVPVGRGVLIRDAETIAYWVF